jgi:hypothetical protein
LSVAAPLVFDPADEAVRRDPFAVFARLRDEDGAADVEQPRDQGEERQQRQLWSDELESCTRLEHGVEARAA